MLDWHYIFSVLPSVASALITTLEISSIAIILALIIGMLVTITGYNQIKFFSFIGQQYTIFFRNTPLLLHLYFIYYGLPKILGFTFDFFTVAVIGLSLLGGSYMAESLRASLQAVPKIQIESAKALGLNRWQRMRRIILPQAFSYSVPTLGANAIFLFKETSIFTAIAGTDITTTAINLINMDYQTNEALLLLVGSYVVVLLPFIVLLNYMEKRMRYAEFGH